MRIVARDAAQVALRRLLRTFPAVALLGPRQCGKSTLARTMLAATTGQRTLFDLERASDLARLDAAPEQDLGLLQRNKGLVCIDEAQRLPAIFTALRPLLDDPARRARYLLLGSASPEVVAGVSESLAGRVGFFDLTPFLAQEVEADTAERRERLWVRGGLPPSFLARSDGASADWREAYVRTFLERDVPALGLRLSPATLRRFWTMLAHLHGGLLNASALAAAMSVSAPTVMRWLDLLEGTFMARRLPPYDANIGKRLVKSPKVYLRDSGVLHTLLGLRTSDALRSHPKVGASWEGWVLEQLLGALALHGEHPNPHFWRSHGGAEVDLLVEVGGRLHPMEIKLGAPSIGRGLVECMKDLSLDRGLVWHGGEGSYPLGRGVWALPVSMLANPHALGDALARGAPRR